MSDAVITLITTTTLLLGSPGPAPLALAATGATFGIRQGIPFLIGILMGLSFAITGAALGLATLFSAFPNVKLFCQFIGAAYMAYVAYKIATAPLASTNAPQLAPSLRDGFILNLINPKAYGAFLAIFSQFLLPTDSSVSSYVATGVTCLLVAAVVDSIWLALGGLLKPLFSHTKVARAIRIVFALSVLVAVGITLI